MTVNYAAVARLALTTKATNVEQGRAAGLAVRNRGPWTPERRQKMRATQAVLNAMSPAARRYYRAEKRSRWLTNVLRADGDRKIFHLEGIDPLTKQPFKLHLEFPLDVMLSEFLTALMNCADAPMTMRLDAGKNAAALMHERPKPVVFTLEQRRERRREYQRKRYRARLSTVAAADEADPTVSERLTTATIAGASASVAEYVEIHVRTEFAAPHFATERWPTNSAISGAPSARREAHGEARQTADAPNREA